MLSRITRKQRIIIGAVVLFMVVIFIAISLFGRLPKKTLYISDTGITLRHIIKASSRDDSFLANTNRNFVTYNPRSGETKLLMNDGLLPTVTNIVWSPDQTKALFSTSSTTANDVLAPILDKNNLSFTSIIWWVADFNNKTYVPLGAEIKDAGWVNDKTVFIVGSPPDAAQNGLYTSDASTIKFKPVYLSENLLTAHTSRDGFLLYALADKQGSLLKIKEGSKEPVTLFTNITRQPFFNKDGSYAVVMLNSSKKELEEAHLSDGDMLLLKTDTGKVVKKLASNQSNEGYWSADGNSFFFEMNKREVLARATIKNGKVSLSEAAMKDKPKNGITTIASSSEGSVFISDVTGRLFVGDYTSAPAVSIDQVGTIPEQGKAGEGFSIFYYPTTNYYGIEIGENPPDPFQGKAIAMLRASGLKPELLDILYDYEHVVEDINASPGTEGVPYPSTDTGNQDVGEQDEDPNP